MKENKTTFARVMDAKGIKPEELAYRAGVTVGYVYKLRRGEQRPSLDTAAKLAELLGVSVDVFLPCNCP